MRETDTGSKLFRPKQKTIDENKLYESVKF
jgi:hypothetical protein